MRIGYARVSTDEQSLDLQTRRPEEGRVQAGLHRQGVGREGGPAGLADAVSHLRSGDVLVIWKLDRLGRTVKGLVDFVADLQGGGSSSAA